MGDKVKRKKGVMSRSVKHQMETQDNSWGVGGDLFGKVKKIGSQHSQSE